MTEYISLSEAARRMGVTRRTLYETYIKRGRLAIIRRPELGKWPRVRADVLPGRLRPETTGLRKDGA